MALIELTNVTKSYAGSGLTAVALRDVALRVEERDGRHNGAFRQREKHPADDPGCNESQQPVS